MKAHALFLPDAVFFMSLPLDTETRLKLAVSTDLRKLGSQLLLKVEFGAVKAGFHGRQGDIHDLGDLLIRAAFEFMEDEHGLLLLGQRSDRLPDEFSRLVHCPGGRGVDPVGRHEARPAPTLVFEPAAEFSPPPEFPVIAIEVPAAVDGDPINPGGDAAIVPEGPGRFIHLEKNVLGDVLGILRVAEQAGAKAENSVLKAIDENLEGAKVFGRDSPQQFPIIDRFRNLNRGTPLNQVNQAQKDRLSVLLDTAAAQNLRHGFSPPGHEPVSQPDSSISIWNVVCWILNPDAEKRSPDVEIPAAAPKEDGSYGDVGQEAEDGDNHHHAAVDVGRSLQPLERLVGDNPRDDPEGKTIDKSRENLKATPAEGPGPIS